LLHPTAASLAQASDRRGNAHKDAHGQKTVVGRFARVRHGPVDMGIARLMHLVEQLMGIAPTPTLKLVCPQLKPALDAAACQSFAALLMGGP
jgi:hypothetical protein